MAYVVMIRGEFKTEFGWDYINVEYSGIRHTDKRKAEAELNKAVEDGCYAFIMEVE